MRQSVYASPGAYSFLSLPDMGSLKRTQDERAKRKNKKGRKREAYGPLVRN
jgi:hypothetical protein